MTTDYDMTKTTYTRPAKTEATAVGERNRSRWTRLLRSRSLLLFQPIDYLLAEEKAYAKARRSKDFHRHAWLSIGIRADHMAVLEVLQAHDLEATGKEIARAEVMAALMAAGLETTINYRYFGGYQP